jgi:hypothetical protein
MSLSLSLFKFLCFSYAASKHPVGNFTAFSISVGLQFIVNFNTTSFLFLYFWIPVFKGGTSLRYCRETGKVLAFYFREHITIQRV